jgi:chromate reductase, NAD(P)H dehydrogenase (quinone)
MAAADFHLFGISGSLRAGSYNSALLRAAGDVLPSGVSLEIGSIADIPLYNDDVREQGDPESVLRFKEGIEQADALLIATPEYNYSIPGVLKNALDWASRPPKTCVLRGKPLGIMGCSSGDSGTVRGQLALRQMFVFTDSRAMLQPELRVPRAGEVFDASGLLIDEELRERLGLFLRALVEWARLVGQ